MYDINKARTILEYSNKHDSKNELVAVISKELDKTKNTISCETDIVWIGTDIYCHGYGSLIREGLFQNPELFSLFI